MKTERSRGFTLIEIMIVAAIVGVLSTVAVPVFLRAQLRARSSERSYVLRAVHMAMEDMYRQKDRFPPDPAVDSLTGDWNPPLPFSTGKRTFVHNQPGWGILTGFAAGINAGGSLVIEGATYYSYRFVAWEAGVPGATLQADGDLDGDGVASTKTIVLLRVQGAYVPTGEVPVDGRENEISF